ncbi:molybdenum cofactor biosynthesis protein B [Oceanospirillum multiglobuliferum]|uniref:Molybdenum cofactor biosynthesis protein B n=1 Tax=Oceanospirillum multiglobuliferum TaxID=64969 RepID=A0A1T4P6Q7_9GAMM|nr:molybdenum cofactor biosynthesis protein B [Oceanospirillum multiglobuliferum]OPX54865.1 molybdenum cofactor biosynthesis protein B [Oceanospirillum multiglobuliferum]SJZ87139.1 molybdenum cofactor biosynthesis protein B [Oceanospirillum multiglobuliferum]
MSQLFAKPAQPVDVPLNIAILTVSDTRTLETDKSGDTLISCLQEAGHKLASRAIAPDDIYQLRAVISKWIADPTVHCIITTGGTGFSGRDSTPEAVAPLLDKEITGFGEVFRMLSYDEIKTSTIQSRALGGLANNTLVFCLPGSTGACRTGWYGVIQDQLDSRHRPCNYVALLTHGKATHV